MPAMTTAADGTQPSLRGRRSQRGFTLIEVVVATLVTAEVILAALALFDFHNKLARVQGQVTDMQQSLRVAQYEMVKLAREAGRGGIPAYLQAGTVNESYGAIAVRNNVGVAGVSNQIAIGYAGTPVAVNGTDILTVRGVFTNSIFFLDPTHTGKVTLLGGATPATATAGRVTVCATSPANSISQDLSPLITAVGNAATAGQVEALILGSPINDAIYAVVELDTANSNWTANQPLCPASTANPNGVLIAFNVTGGSHASAFQQLGAVTGANGLPPQMTGAVTLGILEEYRYYVRQDYLVPGNAATDLAPHLTRARMYPGTETPYYNDPTNLQADVADNILDLQVALGVDNNGDGLITEGTGLGNPPNQTPNTTDDWIYNVAGDAPFPPVPQKPAPLLEVRISTLGKTGNPDPKYSGPTLTNIEDHTYVAADFPNTFHGRTYRRRLLTTVVGLRNL
jgi:type II secretory pathway pseudopilin PulG